MKSILLILLSISAIDLYALPPLVEPRLPNEPDNVVPQMLRDNEFLHSPDTQAYYEQYNKKVDRFLKQMKTEILQKPLQKLVGVYSLVNSKDEKVDNYARLESKPVFYIFNSKYGYGYIAGAPPSSILTINKKGIIFFMTPWWGFLKKIVEIDNKYYIYFLEKNEWKLDEIHEGGKLYYHKSPLPDNFSISDYN